MMTQRLTHTRHKQQGLTIVELMISIALSLIIMAGIFQIFMSSKQTYRVQEALGRMQENARFAMDLLSYDIRMAGNVGCNQNAVVTNQFAGILPDINSGIQGFDIDGGDGSMFVMMAGAANNLAAADIVNNTDALFIQGASSVSGDLSVAMVNSNAQILINNSLPGIEVGDIAIIADCNDAEIFQITGLNGDKDTINHNGLNKIYSTDAQVMPVIYTAYYIATDDNNVRNLYQRSVGAVAGAPSVQAAIPLIEGVEDMQIFYGETIGNTVAYNTANNVANMANVTSIRIHLLLATLEDNLTAPDHREAPTPPQNYWYVDANGNNVQVAVRDNRLFRSMTTTISLRN